MQPDDATAGTRSSNGWPCTFRAWSALALLVLAAGCTAFSGREPTTVVEVATEASGAEEPRATEVAVDSEAVAADEPGPAPAAEDTDLSEEGETLTTSPLDELAEVEPQLSPEQLEEGLDLVSSIEPTFDIPIEINDRVLAWVEVYTGRMRDSTEASLRRSGRYLDRFRAIFSDEGLPQDLVYMAHVESGYKTSAYSRARARGIFQFIAGTARRYGLRVDYWVDERADPEKSARAAARYMTDLYSEFGDWYLALAAYNAGEGKVRRAIQRTGSRDFWTLARTRHLRRETKNHVPAILAATLISKDPAKYGLTHAPDPPVEYETIDVVGAADLRVIARCAGAEIETLRALNPALRRLQTPPDSTTAVHVPPGTGAATVAALEQIPQDQRVLYARHRVARGDTLSEISARYGVGVRAIQDANGLGRRTLIREGQVLRIPTGSSAGFGGVAALAAADGEPIEHRVRRGETLSELASVYRVSVRTIQDANGLGRRTMIRAGQVLRIPAGSHAAFGGVATSNGTPGKPITHRVRSGDTLYEIALRYRTTPKAIAAASGIDVNGILRVGMRLTVVPGVRDTTEAARVARGETTLVAANLTEDAGSRTRVHTVRRGDTLWDIANLYRTTVSAVCRWNGISRSATIHPGARLIVGHD